MGIKYSTAKAILNTHRKKIKLMYHRDASLYSGVASSKQCCPSEVTNVNLIVTQGGIPARQIARKAITKGRSSASWLTL